MYVIPALIIPQILFINYLKTDFGYLSIERKSENQIYNMGNT